MMSPKPPNTPAYSIGRTVDTMSNGTVRSRAFFSPRRIVSPPKTTRTPYSIAGSPNATLSAAQHATPGICSNGQVNVMWVPGMANSRPRATSIQAHPSSDP